MLQVDTDINIIKNGFETVNFNKVLPFRFIAAAQYVPKLENKIEIAMLKAIDNKNKLKGKTVFVVDVSGSMYGAQISSYSEINRAKVACALGILVREICEESAIYATAGNDSTEIHQTKLIPSRRGFALSDAIYEMCHPLGGGGIFVKQVMDYLYEQEKFADRILIITDEQDCQRSSYKQKYPLIGTHKYMINVSAEKNGVGYYDWVHIDGFSESVVNFIQEYEKEGQ